MSNDDMNKIKIIIDYEKDDIESQIKTDPRPDHWLVGINIIINNRSLTGTLDQTYIDDYIYRNIERMLLVLGNMKHKQKKIVPYQSVNYKLTITPDLKRDIVYISFVDAVTDKSYNGEIPDEGLVVSLKDFVSEVIYLAKNFLEKIVKIDPNLVKDPQILKLKNLLNETIQTYEKYLIGSDSKTKN